MTTDTGAQAGVSNDVEARAREVIRSWWDDDIGEDERGEWLGRAMVSLLDHHGIRIVDAADDDRRSEALARLREFVAFTDRIDCMGEFESSEFWLISDAQCRAAWREKRDALAPYLHDDDTGGEG